jgi:hypothetical protein
LYFAPAIRAPWGDPNFSGTLDISNDKDTHHVQAIQPAEQRGGDVSVDDALRQPFGDRRLSHTRVTDQDRVVLRAAAEDADDPALLVVAADDGIDLPLLRERRQVDRVLLERLKVALGRA